jgi:hypothetical protein
MNARGGPWRRLSQDDSWTLVCMTAAAVVLAVLAFYPGFFERLPPLCLMRRLGGYCPGCGLTRACVSLVKLDFPAAVRFNVLVFFVVPVATLRLIDVVGRLVSGREDAIAWPRWLGPPAQWGFLVVCGALTIVRFLSWLMPEWNPSGFALPPEVHP